MHLIEAAGRVLSNFFDCLSFELRRTNRLVKYNWPLKNTIILIEEPC